MIKRTVKKKIREKFFIIGSVYCTDRITDVRCVFKVFQATLIEEDAYYVR